MPEFGVVVETLAGEATALASLGGELREAAAPLQATAAAAEQTGAADACAAFVQRSSTLLAECGPALDQLAVSLATAAECYERVDRSVMGG